MSRCLVALLLFSSCSFFSKKNLKSTTVIANITTNIYPANNIDLKLKTEIYSDSAVIQVFPVIGLNLATILVKEENVHVKNKLNNEETVFAVRDFDPDLNFKTIKNSNKKKQFKDTTYYKNPNVDYTFMDYVNVKTINSKNTYFAPRLLKINIDNSPLVRKQLT